MSDYTSPVVSDESIDNLCSEITKLAGTTSDDIREIKNFINKTITKEYAVNHEPKIELPFEKEYEYIKDKVNKSLASNNKKLDDFTHIFISGYLLNGKTIHPNSIEEDEQGHSVSKYQRLYINGVPYDSMDYICRAEEGGWEKLNVLIIGAPKTSLYKARLDVDYSDIPLKDFKMIVFDEVEDSVYPDINSFLTKDIDTLKCIGNLRWTFSDMCTLRRLEITKDIYPVSTMYMPCLQELIIPNVANVPNINYVNSYKSNIVKLDISNVRGTVGNLMSCNLNADLTLKAAEILYEGFSNCRINTLDTGSYCLKLAEAAFRYSMCTKVVLGAAMSVVYRNAFNSCKNLWRVDFNNELPIALEDSSFSSNTKLTDINFSYIKSVSPYAFASCTSLTNLTFIPKSISCPLYFNASPVITEQSCLNIINAIADDATVAISLHATVKSRMSNEWYCKLENDKYVTCTAEDEGAITQAAALIARGGTLA